jgi:hypothetical protein
MSSVRTMVAAWSENVPLSVHARRAARQLYNRGAESADRGMRDRNSSNLREGVSTLFLSTTVHTCHYNNLRKSDAFFSVAFDTPADPDTLY